MLTDFLHATRVIRQAPGLAFAVILMLVIGIGGSTGMFSLVHAALIAPLPFRDDHRLVAIWERRDNSGEADLAASEHEHVSGHEYLAWSRSTHAFQGMALLHREEAHLTGAGDPAKVIVTRVSAGYFSLLGLQPVLGREFAAGEDRSGGAPVALLGEGLWRRRFAGDPAVVGQTVRLDDHPFTIVGVLPPLPDVLETDLWLPIDLDEHARTIGRHNLSVVARLADGVTLEQAREDVARAAAALEREMPNANTGHGVSVVPLREDIVGRYHDALMALFAAVALLLLTASANVANLLLTRGAVRQREFAVRRALGATRGRIIRLVLVESLLLAGLGGAFGLLVAMWVIDLAAAASAVSIPLADAARLGRPVLLVALATTILAGVGAGLGGALQGAREAEMALGESNRVAGDRSRGRMRATLVGAEVALALMLLAGAGLMINSFVRLATVPPGFSSGGTLAVALDLPGSRYPEAHRVRSFVETLVTRLQSLPGVVAVGGISHLPLSGAENWTMFSIEGRPEPAPGQELNAAVRVVTPDYFRALQIPLKRGRVFEAGDARDAVPLIRWYPQQPYPPGFERPQPPPVAVISEEAARRFWPGQDPLGQRIRLLFSPPVTIVGVVGDVKHTGLDMPVAPHIYLSHNQEPWTSLSIVVRTSGDPSTLAGPVAEHVHSLDPALPVPVRTMDDVLSASLGAPRFNTILIALFAALALGLSAAGIWAVVSYAAARRTREIGVRLALGAAPGEIVRLLVGQGMRPVIAGVVVGLAGAFALTRFLSSLLYGVEWSDPWTFAVVLLFLALVALAACWIPARRASRLDPVAALRVE